MQWQYPNIEEIPKELTLKGNTLEVVDKFCYLGDMLDAGGGAQSSSITRVKCAWGIEMPTPRTVLTGHQSEITCVATIAELGLVVSGSKDGPSLVHSLSGDLLHSLDPPSTCQNPRLISISREAYINMVYGRGNICMFSINGKLLHFIEHKDNIQSLILSRDGQYMMTGGDSGIVEVWRANDFSLLYTYPVCDSSIRSLTLTHDHRFLIAGLATGCLLVFNIDFNKWHHEFQERYT